jgi:hypothetical protein
MINVKQVLEDRLDRIEQASRIKIGSSEREFTGYKVKTKDGYRLKTKNLVVEGLPLGCVNGRNLPGRYGGRL